MICPPCELPGLGIQRCKPAAYTELAAAVPYQHLSLDDEWRHGDALALVDIAYLGVPNLLAGLRINGDCVRIKSVVVDLPVEIGSTPVYQVTAGHALSCKGRVRLVG